MNALILSGALAGVVGFALGFLFGLDTGGRSCRLLVERLDAENCRLRRRLVHELDRSGAIWRAR